MANPLQQFGGAEMRETPRKNKLAGVLADWLAKADQFARAPGGYDNPPAAMLSDALGIPAVQRTLDRYSYGEPLTNVGKANVPLIPQDTADAAMAVAPVVAKWPRASAGAFSGLLGGAGVSEASLIPSSLSRMTEDEMVGAVKAAIRGAGGKKVGLRVMPDDQGHLVVGDAAPNSWKWKNGDYTDKRLNGVSTASLGRGSDPDIQKAIRNLGIFEDGPNGYYYGPKVAVIYGDEARRGEDAGEAVIKNGILGWIADNPRWGR